MRPPVRLFLTDLLWALFAAVFFTYKVGYLFGDIDGEELLPVVYRLLDPSLYPGDAFVDAASHVQPVRAAFTYTLAGFGQIMPVAYAALLLQAVCVVGTAFFLIRIARTLFPDAPWATPLAPVLALVYFGTWTLGGNAYVDNMLLPHSFAAFGGTGAALLFLRKKFTGAGFVLGLAALYQPLLAGQLWGMLGVVRMVGARAYRWRDVRRFTGSFILAVSPLLIATPLYDSPPVSSTARALFSERYFVFRHGLHYLPSLYAPIDWMHATGLATVAASLIIRYRHPARHGFAVFAACGIAAMAVYALLVEGVGWLNVCAVQAFKSSIWIAAASAVVVAGYVGEGISVVLPLRPSRWWVLTATLAGIFYFGGIITHTGSLAGRGLGGDWYRIGAYPPSDLTRIHCYLRTNTPKDAMVLTAPLDVSLLCETQRPTPVSYKGFLHQPAAFLEWDRRYRRIYTLPYIPGQREISSQSLHHTAIYDSLTSAHFDTVCRYDYRIARATALPDPAMRTIRREGDWILLKKGN